MPERGFGPPSGGRIAPRDLDSHRSPPPGSRRLGSRTDGHIRPLERGNQLGMTTREQVEQLLSELVSGAVFEIPRKGVVRSLDAKASYRRRQPLDPTWAQADEETLRVDKALMSSLTRSLSSLVAKFTNPGTGRIGNGLFNLTGGLSTRAILLPEEFAKMMVVGAVRLGAQRACSYLFDWIDETPLRTRFHILVECIRVDQAIRVHGVELSMLATAKVELPLFLSHSGLREDAFSARRIRDAAVVSLDLEHRPALYRPDADTASFGSERLKTVPVNPSLSGTSAETFCEAMMLACGQHVPWLASWQTHGDVCAFMSSFGGGSYRTNTSSARARTDFTAAQLASSIHICASRTQDAGSGDARLNLAIRRWANSIGRPGLPDRLIELRIALEALYAQKGERSVAAGIALRGAWHLGRTFAERVDYRNLLRKVYADASTVIHAGEPKHASRDKSLAERGQEACRQGILKILRNGVPQWDHIVLGT